MAAWSSFGLSSRLCAWRPRAAASSAPSRSVWSRGRPLPMAFRRGSRRPAPCSTTWRPAPQSASGSSPSMLSMPRAASSPCGPRRRRASSRPWRAALAPGRPGCPRWALLTANSRRASRGSRGASNRCTPMCRPWPSAPRSWQRHVWRALGPGRPNRPSPGRSRICASGSKACAGSWPAQARSSRAAWRLSTSFCSASRCSRRRL
mmetsp:Transcript_103796/g.334665  ORF Transcript_103796/g.334665 Transcript_103796/m.334665 type:complete len:205 (+) Transcript_103796:229-843(+)